MKIDPNKHHCAIYCNSDNGLSFGGVYICYNSNTNQYSSSNLGRTNKHPQYASRTDFLAGSKYFQLSEIVVYQKI